MKLSYPRPPTSIAREIAAPLIKKRLVATTKDINALLAELRARGLSHEHAYCGESSMHAVSVMTVLADENLVNAQQQVIEKRIAKIQAALEDSISKSISRFNPARLGGRGAAGRQRDQARSGERRDIMRVELYRLQAELNRRLEETKPAPTNTP